MLTLFRNFRKSLIQGASFRKYLLYAIGEIALVVLGILIALQINKWNEGIKSRSEERVVLSEISTNLQADLEDFERNIIHLQNTVSAANNLIHAGRTKHGHPDTMAFHLFQVGNFPHFSPNISGYELLKSKGLELISDDSIRQRISILYENHYKYIATWEDERIYHNTVHLYPLRNKHQALTSLSMELKPSSLARNNYFNMITDYGGVREILDFENLLNDSELLGLIKDIGVYARFNLEVHRNVKSEVNTVIAEIEKDLN